VLLWQIDCTCTPKYKWISLNPVVVVKKHLILWSDLIYLMHICLRQVACFKVHWHKRPLLTASVEIVVIVRTWVLYIVSNVRYVNGLTFRSYLIEGKYWKMSTFLRWALVMKVHLAVTKSLSFFRRFKGVMIWKFQGSSHLSADWRYKLIGFHRLFSKVFVWWLVWFLCIQNW